jgi:hypothetical protein
MAMIDPCIIFSSLSWLCLIFVCFFNFFISNTQFLAIVKIIKFREKKYTYNLFLLKKLELLNFNKVLFVILSILKCWLIKRYQLLKADYR